MRAWTYKIVSFIVVTLLLSLQGVSAEKFKVVLDPGHGGRDCGAIGINKKVYEKDLNLKVALRVGELLQPDENAEVIFTRKKDFFIPLDERPKIANRAQADLFISIHANASEATAVNGFETYTLGESRNDVSVRENKVAELEENYSNKYNFKDDTDESFIFSNMMLDAGSGGEMSIRLAQLVQSQFKENTDRVDREVRQANFWVLKHILMPGVLVEMGYLSNTIEEDYLSKEDNLEKVALSIYQAIVMFKDEFIKKSKKLDDIDVKDVKDVKNEPVEDEIVYRVQLFSSNQKLPANSVKFKTCTPAIEMQEGNLYKYMYGKEKTFADAQLLRRKAKLDFPDAFIVVFKNGEKLVGADARPYLK